MNTFHCSVKTPQPVVVPPSSSGRTNPSICVLVESGKRASVYCLNAAQTTAEPLGSLLAAKSSPRCSLSFRLPDTFVRYGAARTSSSDHQTCIRLMPTQSNRSWQNVKMNWFSQRESVKLEYTNQFNHVTKYIWIDSIKSKNDSNDSIKSIIQHNINVDIFLENLLVRWPFWKTFDFVDLFWETFDFFDLFGIFWSNSVDWIIPVSPSQST